MKNKVYLNRSLVFCRLANLATMYETALAQDPLLTLTQKRELLSLSDAERGVNLLLALVKWLLVLLHFTIL